MNPTLSQFLAEVEERLAQWNKELPRLIQPEPWLIKERQDQARLVRIVREQRAALDYLVRQERARGYPTGTEWMTQMQVVHKALASGEDVGE